ncbi:LysR family transcriptional regulator [Klebsiella oxytoca]|uniref:HTH-type transcriptional regulator DmlR n=1 Tax=Klebsiella oxytoca TaxID=571 RepID=A0A6N3HL82_KLEOX|nr:LysR family transcriptional regulator [Klebsiella oxytoca]EKU5186395.1 LysR family transcriptional regulator [Klebsiella oxytoca]EKX5085946.1 LysR family transcriptional regulator [Klebsiella oxytoca]EKX5098018.1 LysR family transcriptional regulator [Klebsiella oxytoca]ELQ8990319.1 LysR family transcriptional regulator [Klebsiella oxytoca]CAG0331056.1 HTH-type transcriptional regulator DmlR [Klebsiella oxytoca]
MINELRSMTTFVRTAELGSLSKAADAQQISPQAASKALKQLETHLGVRLFHRTTRNMSLTEEGQRFFEAAKPALMGLQQALATVQQTREEFAGPLRIVGPRSVVQQVIKPVLIEYSRLYPEVQPDVQLDDGITNWVEKRVDVGFRISVSPQEGLIARRLFPLQLIICASPAYLRKYGVPKTLHDLSAHRCSVFRHAATGRLIPWTVKSGDNVQDHYVNPAMSTNDEMLELHAVLMGEVIAQLAGPTAAQYIRTGRLVPVLPEAIADIHGLFLYYGSRVAQPLRVRRFIDLAIERLANRQDVVLSAEEISLAYIQGMSSYS